jgi:predicted nucleic acid-binding protein
MLDGKVFIDTNIFVYSSDVNEPEKRKGSRILLESIGDRCVISTQVMQEYYVTATRKLGMNPLVVKGIVGSMEQYEIVGITPSLIQEAIDCQILSRISFWDALIVAAAESARCASICSEDLNAGQSIRGLRVENPFRKR